MKHARLPTFLRPLAALALVSLGAVAGAQTRELSSSGELLDSIVALVNDGVVLRSELEAETARIVARLQKQGTQLPPAPVLERQVLDRLVIEQLQVQRAEKVGIKVSDETLNQGLATIAERNNVPLAELPALLAREGVDYAGYRRELRQQITIDQLRQRDVLQRISVSPKEVETYLARQEGKASLRQEFLISHILLAAPSSATPEQVLAAESLADDLYKRLQAGEDFAKLAVAYSSGQQALEGGSLGWRKGSELPSLFADVVPGLNIGQVAEPVRNASGFHLIKLDDRRGGEAVMEKQTRARHILLTTNEVLDDGSAREQLKAIRERILAGEDFAAVAKAVSEDPQSALEGGDLGWAGPGNFVPAFEEQLNTLEIDEISEPLNTQFGWHIIQVRERRVYDATGDKQRQEAILAIRNSKLGDEVDIWTRRLRDEAFVEYRL
ncbi:MAG: molecular chaperone SurA [Gammaproteobacteria bacterium]|nr:molecular chaperone SurA [Gammaproteobacteria bacterium]